MKCKICGYDNKKPIGKAIEDSKKGKVVKFKLNKNGLRGMAHDCWSIGKIM